VKAAWAEWAVQKPEPKRVVAERYPEKPLAADTGKRLHARALSRGSGGTLGRASSSTSSSHRGDSFRSTASICRCTARSGWWAGTAASRFDLVRNSGWT